MISADLLIKLLKCSFPVVVIVAVGIYIAANAKKNKNGDIDTTPPPMFGMRSPTDEEAAQIKKQNRPRILKTLIVISLIFLPLVVILCGVTVSLYESEDPATVIVMGFVALSVLLMYIVFISMPIYEMWSLYRKLYSVSDCYFADIRSYIRVNHKGIPSTVYHAVIKDQMGLTWETDLPKKLWGASVGSRCLVIIYASEEKVNRSRKSGRSLYRRTIYVPLEELM